ncbi:unnamed protein product [Closterium sp. NIES-53]
MHRSHCGTRVARASSSSSQRRSRAPPLVHSPSLLTQADSVNVLRDCSSKPPSPPFHLLFLLHLSMWVSIRGGVAGVWQPGPKGSCRPQPQQAKRRLQMDADVDSRSDERLAKVQRSYVLQQVGQQRGQAGQMRGEEVEGGQSGTREQAGASRETGPGSKQAGVGHGEAWACEHDAGKLHGGGGRGNEFMTGGGEGAAGRRCGGAEEDAAGHGQDGQHHHITPRSRIGCAALLPAPLLLLLLLFLSRLPLLLTFVDPARSALLVSLLSTFLFLPSTRNKCFSLFHSCRSDAINMCYVNSTLQALASLPPFLSHLLHLPLPAPLARSSSLRLPVTTELQRLTRQLLGLPRGNGSGAIVGSISSRTRGTAGGVADASAVKRAVGRSARIFVGQEQQDAHEFLCSLLHCLASEATTIAAATASPPHTQAPTHTHTPTQPHDPAHTHTPSPILGEGRVPVGRAGEGGEGEVGREGGRGGGRTAIAERGGEGEARVEEARTADGSGCAVGTNFLSTVEVVRQCEGCGGRERGQEEFLCLSLPVPSSYLARPAPHPTTAGFSPPAPAGSTAGARSSRGSRGSDTDPTAAAAALASLTHHPLSALLQHFFQDETVQGRACTHCHRSAPCRISQAFLRLPRILVLHLNRFQTTFHPTACLEKPTLCREEPSASLDNPPLCEPPHHAPPCPAPPSPHIAQHAHPLASRAPLDTSPPFPENPTTAPPSTPPAPSGKAPQATTSPARSRSPASPLLPAAGASSVNPFSLAKSAARHVVSREVVSKGVVCGLKGGGRLIRRVSKVGADAEEMENGGRVEGQVVGRIKLPSEVRAEEHEEGPRGKGEGRECEEEDEEVEEDWAELLEGAAGVIGEGAGDGGDANPVSVMVDGGRATSSRVGGGGGMEGMQASRGGYECRKNVDRVEIATLLNIGRAMACWHMNDLPDELLLAIFWPSKRLSSRHPGEALWATVRPTPRFIRENADEPRYQQSDTMFPNPPLPPAFADATYNLLLASICRRWRRLPQRHVSTLLVKENCTVSREDLGAAVACFPRLTHMHLSNGSAQPIDDAFLARLAACCPKLTAFHLGSAIVQNPEYDPPGDTLLTPAGFDVFFRGCTQLEHLSMGCLHCEFGLPASLFQLVHLRSFALADLSAVTTPEVKNLSALEAIAIDTAVWDYDDLEPLAHLPRLTSLSVLHEVSLFPGTFRSRRLLERVSLYQCDELQNLPHDIAERLPCLRDLSISACDTLLEQPKAVTLLTGLRSLKLARCPFVGLPDYLGEMNALTTLVLHKLNIYFPASCSQLKALHTLAVIDCEYLDDLPHPLSALTALSTLCLAGSPFLVLPDDIGGLTNLQTVFLKTYRARSHTSRNSTDVLRPFIYNSNTSCSQQSRK